MLLRCLVQTKHPIPIVTVTHSELGSLDLISGLVGMTVGAALMTILIAAGYYSYWLKTGKGIRNLSTLKHDSSKFVESIVADNDNEVSVVVL
jgi:hypothetical protein